MKVEAPRDSEINTLETEYYIIHTFNQLLFKKIWYLAIAVLLKHIKMKLCFKHEI